MQASQDPFTVPWGWTPGSPGSSGGQQIPRAPTPGGLKQTGVENINPEPATWQGGWIPNAWKLGSEAPRGLPKGPMDPPEQREEKVELRSRENSTHLSPETVSPRSQGLLAGHEHSHAESHRGGLRHWSWGPQSHRRDATQSQQLAAEAPVAMGRGTGAAGRREFSRGLWSCGSMTKVMAALTSICSSSR